METNGALRGLALKAVQEQTKRLGGLGDLGDDWSDHGQLAYRAADDEPHPDALPLECGLQVDYVAGDAGQLRADVDEAVDVDAEGRLRSHGLGAVDKLSHLWGDGWQKVRGLGRSVGFQYGRRGVYWVCGLQVVGEGIIA